MGEKCVADNCGKFVARKGQLCKKHKNKSDTERWQGTYKKMLENNPKKLEAFEDRRLANQRKRNGVDPARYKVFGRGIPDATVGDPETDERVDNDHQEVKNYPLF